MYVCNPKLSINNEVFLNTKTCSFLLFGHRICSVRICVCFSRTKRIILFSTNFSSFLPITRSYKKYITIHILLSSYVFNVEHGKREVPEPNRVAWIPLNKMIVFWLIHLNSNR